MKLFYPTVNYSTRHNFFTIRIINLSGINLNGVDLED